MKKLFNLKNALILLILVLILSSCAHPESIQNCVTTEPHGFWFGLWNGMTAPFSFIFSLIFDNISMYAVNNNGGWYNFGFVLGSGILFGGGSKASSK